MKKLLFVVLMLMFSGLAIGQTTLTTGSGTPVLDGVIDPGEWTAPSLTTTITNITLYAMADGQYLYIAATWADATSTHNVLKKQWSFDGAAWSQSGNEDRIAFIWDMGLNGTDGASCVTMCHPPLMHTNVGKVDVWHWKAARSNTMGFADDKYFDIDNRHSDPGTSSYSDNLPQGSGFPSFMATGDPGANVDFLLNDATSLAGFDPFGLMPTFTTAVAVPFDSNLTFTAGAVAAGYVNRIPSGDRASIQAAGNYDNGVWTVEFKKPYAGSDFDFAVVPGNSVNFSLEIYDNEGGTHALNGFDPTVYTLEFPPVGIEPISSNVPKGYSLKQNYPNPFNPSTTIEFDIAGKSKVNLTVFNVMGQKVATLVDDELSPSSYRFDFVATNLSSGVYFYNLTVRNLDGISGQDFTQTRKMVLMK